MSIITQITPEGKRLQLDSETYTEINQRTGFVTIHQGQHTGSEQDWGGKVIGYLSLAQAVAIVNAALDMKPKPKAMFDWSGDFNDVLPAEWRDDFVGM